MPRRIRVEFPGAIYHMLSRGDRREDIFYDDVDRQDFLKALPETCQKIGFGDRMLAYPWSILAWYLAAPAHRPTWIRVDRLLGEHGIGADTPAERREFEDRMEALRRSENDGESWEPLRAAWCVGGEAFRKELLDRMEGRLGEHHPGE